MATKPQETGTCFTCRHRVNNIFCNELIQRKANRLPSDRRDLNAPINITEPCIAYRSSRRDYSDGSYVLIPVACYEAKPTPSNPLKSNPQCMTRF